jgi:hypothetical protein
MQARPEFKDVEVTVTNGVDHYYAKASYKQQMTMFVPTVGLVWKL